jgi:hypothetical protein
MATKDKSKATSSGKPEAVMARVFDRAAKDPDLTPDERRQAKERANATRKRARTLEQISEGRTE